MDHIEARTEAILKAIVAEFIGTGEPVGSRTVSKKSGIALSAASIRNIMSDLTEMGFISQPHVSAGRIPTDKGYRFYVDRILQSGWRYDQEGKAVIEDLIRAPGMAFREVLKQSSSVLAGLSRQAGVVTAPAPEIHRFRTIEFIKVAEDRIVVVLVSNTGLVQNKMIHDEDSIDPETLERYSRVLNDMLKDLDLTQARHKIEEELKNERTRMDAALAKTLNYSHAVLSQDETREIFIDGQSNIIEEPEFLRIDQLRALLLTFQEKSNLLKILDKTLKAEGIQVFIGSEHGVDQIDACSIVAYPIRTEGRVLAIISVVGPKRMDYQKVVPLVLTTATVLRDVVSALVETPL